jgi:hypothetical protein
VSTVIETTTSAAEPAEADFMILDLGKQKRKKIKQMRGGRGTLMGEVRAAFDNLRANGAIGADAQPVIVIVREKRKKKKGRLSLF